ncbi:TPA: hypothetical protein HA361_05740 [Candidatus Woesearchaeota archaeon]|nr:hypothetical protein [Candidatus Woesearchaeota archaeon]HII68869.1 hypothetical protein [Candidatus Woesearchaeota archaeon]
MSVVGFNFTKILAEKQEVAKGKVNIKNNVTITGIEESDISLGKGDQKAMKISFTYTSEYEPKVGKVTIEGSMLYIAEPANAEDILKQWKKEKKIASDIIAPVLNATLSKCTVQALNLTQEINLPPPIQLPRVDLKKK